MALSIKITYTYALQLSNSTPRNLTYRYTHAFLKWWMQMIIHCTTVYGSKILETMLYTHILGVGYTHYRNPYNAMLCNSQWTRNIWCIDVENLQRIKWERQSADHEWDTKTLLKKRGKEYIQICFHLHISGRIPPKN